MAPPNPSIKQTVDEICRDLVRDVYLIGCKYYESIGEGQGYLIGNGHHMAQDLAAKAEAIFREHLRR